MSGNLSERVFLLELFFAMVNILNCNNRAKRFNQYSYIVNHDLVVAKVVLSKIVNFLY